MSGLKEKTWCGCGTCQERHPPHQHFGTDRATSTGTAAAAPLTASAVPITNTAEDFTTDFLSQPLANRSRAVTTPCCAHCNRICLSLPCGPYGWKHLPRPHIADFSPMSSDHDTQKPPRNPFSLFISIIKECIAPGAPSTPTDGPSEGPNTNTVLHFTHHWNELMSERRRRRVTIDVLPDEVLLDIFDFYRVYSMNSVGYTWAWHNLVHVCRRWRRVVFASPHYLDLRLVCKSRTPVRKVLDVWPAFPIGIQAHPIHEDEDGVVAALEHPERVSWIELSGLTSFQLERCASVMQETFPLLTFLWLELNDVIAPVLTDDFLGGSAPHLRTVLLNGVPFPTLPKLLLSTSGLVDLQLWNIPATGYFSPEVLVICLSTLTRLGSLSIEFQSPRFPDRTNRHPPPLTRTVLPALTRLHFQGVSEYLEDLVVRIDAPLLDHAAITFFNQLIFDIPQLPQFLHRTEMLTSPTRAVVTFRPHTVKISLYSSSIQAKLDLQIPCNESDWQISSMEQICVQCSPILSHVEGLEIREGSFLRPEWLDDLDSAQWLELFDPFAAVQSLHVSEELQLLVAPAFHGLTGRRAAEMLPALRTLFLEGFQPHGSVSDAIEPFTDSRRLSDRPVAVLRWHQ